MNTKKTLCPHLNGKTRKPPLRKDDPYANRFWSNPGQWRFKERQTAFICGKKMEDRFLYKKAYFWHCCNITLFYKNHLGYGSKEIVRFLDRNKCHTDFFLPV